MAEDSSTQPPAQAADKAQAPATFSSFINKNTSGKKFAPKAARRRPAAAAKPAATEPTPTSQPEPEPSSAPAEPAAAAPLPTPASTQPATQPVEPRAPPPLPEYTPAAAPGPAPVPAPAVEAPQPPPEPQQAPRPSPQQVDAPQSAEDDIEAGRSRKRRRIESAPRQSTPMVPVAVMVPPQDAQTGEIIPQQPAPPAETLSSPSAELGEPSASTGATPPTEAEDLAQSKRRRRTLPWTAVNHPQEEGGEASGAADPPAKKKRAPPKPRGKKKAAEVVEDGEPQEDGDGEEAEPSQKRPSARARGKRHAEAPEIGGDGQPVEPLPKKPRKPRKDKGKQPAAEDDAVEGEGREEGDAAAKPKPKPKPRAPKRKKSTPAEGAEGEEGSVEPKKRGRPPREDTPPDAEDHVIDPDTMCMDDLASRNIRVGKLSRREREMRKIDWDAVKQRRREEDARHITTKEAQAAVDKLLESGDVEQVSTGPRYHVVDGRIELVQDSGTIDRERDADREIEMMTITEEDDLTTRITSRSFMKNNKRFPNEFVLPGQGKRWNAQSTAMFYQGLRSFGTDFQMIAHMFPGMTRRSIKTKFTREERENPDIVRDCLRGESTLASHWGEFLEASQLQDDSFADSDRIKRELEEEEARMREQINEALKEKEEREHQKRLAGVTEDGDAGEKENAKGKKKRKTKDKNVTFQEEGLEILGEVDDDPNWGQE
ncbi:Transcription factor TFIIIB component B [Didymella keratinophila]|nr:Transcription factor TFIIIB component B [Didymella keratinophila]